MQSLNHGDNYMNKEQQTTLVSEWYEGYTRRDGERFLATLADDIKIQPVGNSPFSGTFNGKETIKAGLGQLYAVFAPLENPQQQAKWKIMVADGTRVVGMMSVFWQSATIGNDYHQTYCQVFEFKGDKISRIWEFFDTALIQTSLAGNTLANPETPVAERMDF
jgi:ketosteroid isomerase-like protein